MLKRRLGPNGKIRNEEQKKEKAEYLETLRKELLVTENIDEAVENVESGKMRHQLIQKSSFIHDGMEA